MTFLAEPASLASLAELGAPPACGGTRKPPTRRRFGGFCVCSRVLAVLAAFVVMAPTAAAQPTGFDLQAHRGGRGETTEESLRAFAKSLELGVSTLELDIVITKDGQPLVWHDPAIEAEKCSDTAPAFPGDPAYPYVGKLVYDLTLVQIRTLDCGKRLGEFPDAEVVRGNKIAVLPEVFALTDSYHAPVRFNVETKVQADKPGTSAGPQEFVDVILAAVRSAGKVDRVEIQSFDWRTLPMVRRARALNPVGGVVRRADVGAGVAVARR